MDGSDWSQSGYEILQSVKSEERTGVSASVVSFITKRATILEMFQSKAGVFRVNTEASGAQKHVVDALAKL